MNKVKSFLAGLPGIFGYSLYQVLCSPFKILVVHSFKKVKWFWQRGVRGYSDRDVWNLYVYTSSWLPQALRQLQEGIGHPLSFSSQKEWHKTLEKMAVGFEADQKLEEDTVPFNSKEYKKLNKVRAEGLKLFCKHYHSLWD